MKNINTEDKLYEARKIMFEDFEKNGYKYIARDKDGALFTFSDKPIKLEKSWRLISVDGTWKDISLLSRVFTDIGWEDEKPFRIPCVNWDDVPADTKVIVTGEDGSEWNCHFARKVSNNSILVYRDGKTSWTSNDVVEVDINNVRLA